MQHGDEVRGQAQAHGRKTTKGTDRSGGDVINASRYPGPPRKLRSRAFAGDALRCSPRVTLVLSLSIRTRRPVHAALPLVALYTAATLATACQSSAPKLPDLPKHAVTK